MSKASTNPGLFQRLLTRPAPADQDAADLGTAFGMEVCLDQAAAAHSLPVAVPRSSGGWMQRLAARARSTP